MSLEFLAAKAPVADQEATGRTLTSLAASLDLTRQPIWSLGPDERNERLTEPQDADEQRADAVADVLMAGATPPPQASGPPGDAGGPPAQTPPPWPSALRPTGTGRPLPAPTLRWAQAVSGTDLSRVRLHDSAGDRANAADLDARAFTLGHDIVLGNGAESLRHRSGLRTLAHELGHVIAPPANGRIGRDPSTHVAEWQRFFPANDVDTVIGAIPEFLAELAAVTWDEKTIVAVWDDAAQDADAPTRVLQPQVIEIITENTVVTVGPDAAVEAVDPIDRKKFNTGIGGMRLLDLSTGVSFDIGIATLGDKAKAWSLRPGSKGPKLAGARPGQSVLVVQLHGLTLTDDQINALRARAKTTAEDAAKDKKAWAAKVVDGLKKAEAAKAAKAGDPNATSPTGQGKGDSGEGKGAGHGKGDGIGDGDQPGSAGGSGDDKTRSSPLQGPVQYVPWVAKDGTEMVAIGQDRAWTAVALREGESEDSLEARGDTALDKLRASRDPANSKSVAGGATSTGFVQPKGSTQGATQEAAAAEAQAKGTPTALTPGEQVPGAKHGANAAAYPATMTMTGKQKDAAALTVSGATNEFTMDLDYAALSLGFQDEVFNRMQTIQFYWEVIDVSGLTKEKAAQLAKETKVGDGEQETGWGALTTNFKRDTKDIAEDQQKDMDMMSDEGWPWEARAQYLMVIGLSNVVRTLGSIVGSFIDVITEPLNGRQIGFDKDGDYLVRCVATPQVSDEARDDPDHHVIRASSVQVMPVRVQQINVRAKQGVDAETADIAAKQAAVDKAIADKASNTKVENAKADLKAVTDASQLNGMETLESQVKQTRASLDIARALQSHQDSGTKDDQWSDDEVMLRLRLLKEKMTVETFIQQREAGLKALTDDDHLSWATDKAKGFVSLNGISQVRPRVVLASEETGQVTDILLMLGQTSTPGAAPTVWHLVDITTSGTRDVYIGSSPLAGLDGQQAAIRDAFRNFAENGDYGRGTLAIRVPSSLATALGSPSTLPADMTSAPGKKGRFLQRLKDLAKVAMIAGMFATGGLSVAIGAVGGVAGAIGSVDSLVKRSRTGHLMDIGTVFDALGVIAGVASVASVGTYFARGAADSLAELGKTPEWVQGLERTEKVLHIHAKFGMVQQVVTIPIELAIAWNAIDKDTSASEGQRNSRRMRALLHAVESGVISIVMIGGGSAGDEEPATAKGDEPLPAGTGKDEANAHADNAGPAKPPVREGPSAAADGTKTPSDPPAPKKPLAESVAEAKELAQQQISQVRQTGGRPGKEEVEPETPTEKPGTTQVPATQPKPEQLTEHAAARAEAVELLKSRLGKDRQLAVAKDVPPPPLGTYQASIRSATEAVASYDKAVSEAGGREVGLYFNARTGKFQVEVGTEHAVKPPAGGDWQAVVHLHPNPDNVTTLRLPAPHDISLSVKAAEASGGTHVEYVQSAMPDGSSGLVKVTVTTNPTKIVVEMAASGGIPARTISVDSPQAYAGEYDRDTTFLDVDSEEYQWMMKDLHDFHSGTESDSQTARGTAKPSKAAGKADDEDLFADTHETVDDRAATEETPLGKISARITRLRRRIRDEQELTNDKARKKIYDDDLARLDKAKQRSAHEDVTVELDDIADHLTAERQAMAPVPVLKVRELAQRARTRAANPKTKPAAKAELLKIAAEADSLAERMDKDPENGGRSTYDLLGREIRTMDREDYEIVVPLLDETVRTQVTDWIQKRSEALQREDIGKMLMEKILAHLKTADALTLQQSPRGSGEGASSTDAMRVAVKKAIEAGRYPDDYTQAFLEAARPYEDGWPRDGAEKVWEVDHVAELWLGGPDDITNFMALPKTVHKDKSDLFTAFRNAYRSGKVTGDQTDIRER